MFIQTVQVDTYVDVRFAVYTYVVEQTWLIGLYQPCIWFCFLVLTIFIEEAYLAFKSIFHKALNLFSPIVKSRSYPFLEPTSTRNKGKVSCSVQQRGHLMGLEPTTSTLQVRRALPTVPRRPYYARCTLPVRVAHVQYANIIIYVLCRKTYLYCPCPKCCRF